MENGNAQEGAAGSAAGAKEKDSKECLNEINFCTKRPGPKKKKKKSNSKLEGPDAVDRSVVKISLKAPRWPRLNRPTHIHMGRMFVAYSST